MVSLTLWHHYGFKFLKLQLDRFSMIRQVNYLFNYFWDLKYFFILTFAKHFSESLDATTLVYFAISFYLLTIWTYGLSVSAGLFIPCLATGAAWGRLIGLGVQCIFPNVVRLINIFFVIYVYILYFNNFYIYLFNDIHNT